MDELEERLIRNAFMDKIMGELTDRGVINSLKDEVINSLKQEAKPTRKYSQESYRSHSKQLHAWIPSYLYDACKELVDNGLIYKSMAELVRAGMQSELDKNSGYMDTLKEEVYSQFAEDDMVETKCIIDGTIMRMRLNARWMKLNATNQLGKLIEDLHNPALSTEAIGNKYGTRIELYNMHEIAPGDQVNDDGYKQTYAYKLEHGLIDGTEDDYNDSYEDDIE